MARHTQQAAPADLLSELSVKIAGLRKTDDEWLKAQLEYERAGVSPRPPSAGPDARKIAAGLLNGHASATESESSDSEKLHAILIEREAIKIAVETLERKETQARIVALHALIEETGQDWRGIVLRRVRAILDLRSANIEANIFRQKLWAAAKMNPALICDPEAPVFGSTLQGPFYDFLQAAVAAGIVTRKEITAAGEVKQ